MARWDAVQIDASKILDYLLAADHPIGGGKAAYFLAAGYTREAWQRLKADLISIGQDGTLVSSVKTSFGIKSIIDGSVESPSGKQIALRTVWIRDQPGTTPRLVTAYPQ